MSAGAERSQEAGGRRALTRRFRRPLFTLVVPSQSQHRAIPGPGPGAGAPGRHVDEAARKRFASVKPLRQWSMRARLLGSAGAVALLVLLILVVLAIPLFLARHDAMEARSELANSKRALMAGNFTEARASEEHARQLIASAQGLAHGWPADLWTALPATGTAVRDGRHLLNAMEQADQILRIGVRVYPKAMGPGSTLVSGTSVDVPLLRKVSHSLQRIGPHLERASDELDQVEGTTPLLGGELMHDRNMAIGELAPISRSYRKFSPLMARLPDVLGAHGPKTYLVAILNPAELRYSGGATLSFSTLSFDHGTATFGASYYVIQLNQEHPFLQWPRVPGNTFHSPGPRRLTAATFSPYWQVSGEELLRGWHAQTGQQTDGLIALDLQALAGLFRVTGPMQVPGYGTLDANNLVHTLAGSYDTHQDTSKRHQLNSALIPAFRQKFLEGGRFVQKARALATAGAERHFFVYTRDHATEQALGSGGFNGNLSSTP